MNIPKFFRFVFLSMLVAQPLLMTSSSTHARTSFNSFISVEPVAAKEAAARAIVGANYGKLPLSFEANRGQAKPEIKFLARAGSSSLLLKSTEAVLVLSKAAPEKAVQTAQTGKPKAEIRNPQSAILKMKLVGANPNPRIIGLDEQQTKCSGPQKLDT